ncbi:hypothetical protein LPTSP4_11080 [Leptospira ryugenii]|uniref:Uncharacterized protein n=1 Tax=Leptospira ryugenii TaxID=1917863 RepID=A0A2P2DY89_9LEPT|nr:hypothetical protein [Leptospira ryugenii]GBF49592.1 hypothetical protein LPTSP4_11080 [Leptospira ryugenii]
MIQLTDFEKELQSTFSLSDKDTRRLERVISDLCLVVGMQSFEIFDFLRFGAEDEFAKLKDDYNWEAFRIRIQKKLIKRSP